MRNPEAFGSRLRRNDEKLLRGNDKRLMREKDEMRIREKDAKLMRRDDEKSTHGNHGQSWRIVPSVVRLKSNPQL